MTCSQQRKLQPLKVWHLISPWNPANCSHAHVSLLMLIFKRVDVMRNFCKSCWQILYTMLFNIFFLYYNVHIIWLLAEAVWFLLFFFDGQLLIPPLLLTAFLLFMNTLLPPRVIKSLWLLLTLHEMHKVFNKITRKKVFKSNHLKLMMWCV